MIESFYSNYLEDITEIVDPDEQSYVASLIQNFEKIKEELLNKQEPFVSRALQSAVEQYRKKRKEGFTPILSELRENYFTLIETPLR